MIDAGKVKRFWEGRAGLYNQIALESVANLEQDEQHLRLKIDEESKKVFAWLPDLTGLSILDLGAGVGQWTFRFAARGASRVVAVEYAAGLAEIGQREAAKRACSGVEFRVSPAEEFDADEQFDLVFISGLFVYLTDPQCDKLVQRLSRFIKVDGRLLLRDGTGTPTRHEINDRHSEHLGELYSATYRTRDDYIGLMESIGLIPERDENMFPEGHPLNKYPETRLRLYSFRKGT